MSNKKYPKLNIQKKIILDKAGHFRFYSPYGKGRKPVKLDMKDYTEIKTEKQLLRLIYNWFGAGEYLILAHVKGRKGFWVFWRGEINDEGFIFFKKTYNKKNIQDYDNDLREAEDDEEKEILEDMKEEAIKEEKIKTKKKRYGFEPFLKPSCRRGEFTFWEDNTDFQKYFVPLEKEITFHNKKPNENIEDWGEKPKQEELEQW